MSGASISARIGGNGGTTNNSATGSTAANGLMPPTSLVALAEQIEQSGAEQMGDDGLAGNLGRDLAAAQQAKGEEKALLLGQNGGDLDFSQILNGGQWWCWSVGKSSESWRQSRSPNRHGAKSRRQLTLIAYGRSGGASGIFGGNTGSE